MSIEPKVLNLRDTGYLVPDGAVYVGRRNRRYGLASSEWANPFPITGKVSMGERVESIRRYREWLLYRLDDDIGTITRLVNELKGKDLVCWCYPKPCHAEILLLLANDETCKDGGWKHILDTEISVILGNARKEPK